MQDAFGGDPVGGADLGSVGPADIALVDDDDGFHVHGAALSMLARRRASGFSETIVLDRPRRNQSALATRPRYSALAPANFTTLPRRSVSLAKYLANSPGDVGKAEEPSSASRAMIFGSARPSLTSLLSRSTISAGVPRGAPRP